MKRMPLAPTVLSIQARQYEMTLPKDPEFVKIVEAIMLRQDLQQRKIVTRSKNAKN